MATLYTHQSSNVAKTWFLMAGFLAVIVALGYFASVYYNDSSLIFIALVFSIVMNIGSYWFSDKVALAVSRAVAIDPVNNPDHMELKRVVDNLAITAGLPSPRVYIINDEAPNAFATGRNKNHAAIAVTTGLLGRLDRAELEGVLAHEMAHIGNKDILIATVVVILVGLVSLFADIFLRSRLFGGGNREGNGNNILAIVGIAFIVLSPILAVILQLAISRRREFLADATGALITRYPEGLANALRKISSYDHPMEHASNATAHMYISNPFGAKAKKGLSALFMTHPHVEDRIKALVGER